LHLHGAPSAPRHLHQHQPAVAIGTSSSSSSSSGPATHVVHAVLVGVAQVNGQHVLRAGDAVDLVAVHQRQQALQQVRHVLEGPRLRAVAVQRQRVAAQRLLDEVGDHSAVVGVHARAEGVEDARDADRHAELVVLVAQRLGDALALVVARARADAVDVPPVRLALWVHLGVAVDLRRGRQQQAAARALGEAQHVERAQHARLDRLRG